MENQEILQTMHDFLNYVEVLKRENDRLELELNCAEMRLNKLTRESECATRENVRWVSVEEELPDYNEQVVVETKNGTRYMQTFNNDFVGDIVAWLRLP